MRGFVQPAARPCARNQDFVWAFDLLELDGDDLCQLSLDRRKGELKALLKRVPFGLALNDYVAGDGPALFAQACAVGLEGIVSKRRSSPYRSAARRTGSRQRTRRVRRRDVRR